MEFSHEVMLTWFSNYAYEPTLVYTAIILLMVASSFGFPVPEELTLLSAGFVAYMARNPDLFPPPGPEANGVNTYVTAIVAFLAVFLSDFLVFSIGRKFGKKVLRGRMFNRLIKRGSQKKIFYWTRKYGVFACGIFRFTPGLRFPGHMACGMMGIPTWKFALVDGTAALVSVPIQVFLIAYYGDTILVYIKEFKMFLMVALGLFLIYVVARKLILKTRESSLSCEEDGAQK